MENKKHTYLGRFGSRLVLLPVQRKSSSLAQQPEYKIWRYIIQHDNTQLEQFLIFYWKIF